MTPTEQNDTKELRKLAEAATPGPWELGKHGAILGGPVQHYVNGSSRNQIVMTTGAAEWMRDGEKDDNAAYIAAANPAAILALLDRLERAEAAAGAVPEGYVLVPKMLTVEMALALQGRDGIEQAPGATYVSAEAQSDYDRLLATAPSAPVAAQAEPVKRALLPEALCRQLLRDYFQRTKNGKHRQTAVLSELLHATYAHGRAMAATPPAPMQEAGDGWISVEERLPECDMAPGSFGVEVIVYPMPEKGESTAFFGCRNSNEPDFYKYGSRVTGVTHWMPLPEAPRAIATSKEAQA